MFIILIFITFWVQLSYSYSSLEMPDEPAFSEKANALRNEPPTPSRTSITLGEAVETKAWSDSEFQAANSDFASIDERAVLRKMDICLIPILAMLYLMSFLDRGNIGNAKIQGLTKDLHLTGQQFSWTCENSSLYTTCYFG